MVYYGGGGGGGGEEGVSSIAVQYTRGGRRISEFTVSILAKAGKSKRREMAPARLM
jgi:hypothetical protein